MTHARSVYDGDDLRKIAKEQILYDNEAKAQGNGQLQLDIDWKLLTGLEQKVGTSEVSGIRARWEFGCYLRDNVPKAPGGRGKTGPLEAIATELCVGEEELRRRRKFAERYPTEEKLHHAMMEFSTWHEIVNSALSSTAHLSSAKDEWSTPQDLWDELHAEFGFTLDVCASKDNAKCARYYTHEDDGLAQTWTGVCWMNPPYSDLTQWLEKAHEAGQAGATVVCLVPARTDVNWFWNTARTAEIRFLKGRLHFTDDDGNTGPAPFPSCLVIFGTHQSITFHDRT